MSADTDCSVYVIGFDLDKSPSKVGIAGDPVKRMANLQTAHHQRLVLAGSWATPEREIARELEKAFHDVMSEHRLSGEWFDLTPKACMACLTIALGTLLNIRCGMEPEEVNRILAQSRNESRGEPVA